MNIPQHLFKFRANKLCKRTKTLLRMSPYSLSSHIVYKLLSNIIILQQISVFYLGLIKIVI